MIEKHFIDLKNIRKNTQLMDYYFMGRYSFSPYFACEHACKYCDGRAERYYVEGNFEKDIVIRKNIPDLLKTKLPTYREQGTVLIGSGVSDPYQPVEKELELMKQSLECLKDYSFPVSVMTKSTLALRDIDLFDAINQKSGALLMVSLVYPNDTYRQIFEPFASSVPARLDMIRQFKERGIPVYVLAMPLLPGISDDKASVTDLMTQLKQLNVDAVMPGSLTLRPGKQKEVYFETIDKHYPELLPLYQKIYSGNYPSGSPERWYTGKVMPSVYNILKELQLPTFLPHRIYKGQYPKYDEVYFLLKHMKQLYKYAHVDITALEYAERIYVKWYKEQRKTFNRKRSMTQEDFEALLWSEINHPASPILGFNKKLTDFIKEAVFGDQLFDYTKLKLASP